MEFSSVVTVFVVLILGITLLLVLWAVLIRRRTAESEMSIPPESLESVSEAVYEAEELPASLVSEQIEEKVKERIATHPDLAGTKLDFATGSDESLEIWIDGEKYADVSEIPDERIRSAIDEAVKEFNL